MGDTILSVNGDILENRKHSECVDILRNSGATVTLHVKFNPLARFHLGDAPQKLELLSVAASFPLPDLRVNPCERFENDSK